MSALVPFVSAAAVVLGMFIASSPMQAVRIWGWENFRELRPPRQMLYLRWYRAMGILVSLSGLLVALDEFLFH